MIEYKTYLKNIVLNLPDKPGVYQYIDDKNEIIYVGKAKSLRKRVSSYFVKNLDNAKTRILVRKIRDIRHIIVETETDALLLENNLIKKYKPRYNVLLKDDKSFPYICVKNESFPRVFMTRNVVKDGSKYFGPYTSVGMVRLIVALIRQLYPLRTCRLNLSKEQIDMNKYKVCLEYHIGNCNAPCVGEETEEKYLEYVKQIKKILNGDIKSVLDLIKSEMEQKSMMFEFEEANQLKEKLVLLDQYRSKSTVVNTSINNVDVYSIMDDQQFAFVNFMKVTNGSIIQVNTTEIKKKLNESKQEVLEMAIIELRNRFKSFSKEIVVPFIPEFKLEGVIFVVPKIGDKKKLLKLSQKNAYYYRLEKLKQKANIDPEKHSKRILNTLKSDLRLNEIPVHIECFDNSNIQGANPVASCVVFRNAKPSKKDYRHFNIKTVEGPDDFASMEEIIYRRYKRLIDEDRNLPQLIIIDGGKGQLSAALKSLEKLDLRGKISIIGIAKKLEEIYFPGDSIPIYLDKNSESLKLIQHARNEAHRFGITFHRNQRSKNFINSELDQISGIGEKSKELLLKEYKTIEKIKELDINALKHLLGKNRALLVYQYFKNK